MKIADISSWQGTIDWSLARKELSMVIFRASVGNKKDEKYVEYATQCGIPFGVYHFFKAGNKEEAEKETKFFYECATQNNLKPLFYVMDIEFFTQTAKTVKGICETILATLKELGAQKIGIYIGQEKYVHVKSIINNFDFVWIPRYGKNNGTANSRYKPIYPCDLWQYTDKGAIAGVKEKVDLNLLNGSKTINWFLNKQTNSTTLGNRTLKIGMKGNDVKELQTLLNSLGYNCGNVDGIFGEKTKLAVQKYQQKYNLVADGICGKLTFAKLIG